MDTHRRRRPQLAPHELKSRINSHRRYTGRRFGNRRATVLSSGRGGRSNVISLLSGAGQSFWFRIDTICYLASLLVSCLVLIVMWTAL